METAQFIDYIEQFGLDGKPLHEAHPALVDMLAKSWSLTLIFGRVLDKAFIGNVGGQVVSERDGVMLRKIASLHNQYRRSMFHLAPSDFLKKIGTNKVALIIQEQEKVALSKSIASLLSEAHQLIAKDSLLVLDFLKVNNIDVNQRDKDGLTLCAVAAQSGADKCMYALCKMLANPNITDSVGNTPLHWSCAMVHEKVTSVLLYHGVNPNAINISGATPLMLALSKNNLDLAQKLLEYGADIRIKDLRGNGALHRAVLARNVLAVKFLIDCGASIDESNFNGQTPVSMSRKDVEMTSIFMTERTQSVVLHTKIG